MIPVDLVVGAVCGVAARGPNPDHATTVDVTQVASGSANPLRYRRLVDLVRAWFLENPLYDTKGQPIVVPDWTFLGRGRVQGAADPARSALSSAPRPCCSRCHSGDPRPSSARVWRRSARKPGRALSYVELYGA